MKCEFCGKDESLPFVCNYCAGVFCADHRLPEAHACKGDLTQKRAVVAPPPTTFTWSSSGSTYTAPTQRTTRVFSAIEVRDIAAAWLGLGFAFFLSFVSQSFGLMNLGKALSSSPGGVASILVISLITVGSGFVLHELSHKFTAQRYGYWAEFRMWPLGLVLALVTSLIGFIFAAPGATYISGVNISEAENGKISLAGPLTNVAVAAAFLPLFLFGGGFWFQLGSEGVFVNVFLALFNLLPVMPLDGAKVFAWSRARWAVFFVPLAAIFLAIFFA